MAGSFRLNLHNNKMSYYNSDVIWKFGLQLSLSLLQVVFSVYSRPTFLLELGGTVSTQLEKY